MIEHLITANYDKAIKSAENVIIEFSADWCGPCKIMKPILEKVSKQNIKVFDVNIEEEHDLTVKYGIRNIPTTFYYKNGDLVNKTVGVQEESKILSKFDIGEPEIIL